MPTLKELEIQLTKQDDAKFIIQHMPTLETLNGVSIDRKHKYETEVLNEIDNSLANQDVRNDAENLNFDGLNDGNLKNEESFDQKS